MHIYVFKVLIFIKSKKGHNFALDKRTNSNLVAINNWIPSDPVETATASPQQAVTVENLTQPNTVSDVQQSYSKK